MPLNPGRLPLPLPWVAREYVISIRDRQRLE